MTTLDQKLVKTTPSDVQTQKKEPLKFAWMKNEFAILVCIGVVWYSYILIDLALLMRYLITNKDIKIHGLSPGYFGIPKDTNDSQWNHWRENLNVLIAIAIIHLGTLIKNNTQNDLRRSSVLVYHIVFGICYVGYIERAGFLYWLLFTGVFFTITHFAHTWKMYPRILWGLSLVVLYFNERYGGYGFLFISKSLDDSLSQAPVRWNIIFNMTLLRIISFGMDLHWASRQLPVAQASKESLSYRNRQETHQPLKNYNLLAYYSYLLYVPLFLTGPIVSFNAWISQIYIPQKDYTRKDLVKYGLIKLFFVFVCFEIFLHIYYINAILRHPENVYIWTTYFKTRHLLLTSLLMMFFLWFKFLVLWRFARFWALLDGIETPENMNRCVVDNPSFEGFWRSWHRSFNQWLIRYIYIPWGGNKAKVRSIALVFTFVGLWHDMNLNLLLWCGIICITLMVEMNIKSIFSKENKRYLWKKVWFRYLCAFLSTFVILSMNISNLIGYGLGYDGFVLMVQTIVKNGEIGGLIGYIIVAFLDITFIFKIRELEDARGDSKKF